MRPRGLYKTQNISVALKKFPWATKGAQRSKHLGRISNSVSRKETMSDLIFHVYKDDKVKAHNLTVNELESLIDSKKVKLGEDEIEVLELSKNTEGSY